VEYNEPSVFAAVKSTKRPKATSTALQWYYRLSHPSPKVILHLPRDVKVLETHSTPSTTEYKVYALAKAKNVISRVPT